VESGVRKPSFLSKFLFDLLSLKGKKHYLIINSSFIVFQSLISYDWIMECWVKHAGLFKLVVLWFKYVVVDEKWLGDVFKIKLKRKKWISIMSKDSTKTWVGGLNFFGLIDMKFF
jgi:hypothetical protein